ncbi:hypothetical protein AB0I51_30800 [Streptomyces sp. NPDC050549]|uniref:hypothetical protein n=1 Tax=Streptomyces sp. NPDC050549 TaxID=3155406 RepID=UPI00343A1383
MPTSRALHHVCLGAAVLAIGLIAPAALVGDTADATATATVTAPSRSGSPQSTVDHVTDFYGAYTDALYDSGHGRLTDALRSHYLTADLRRSLARWEAVHHMDGVLRGKSVPTEWKVVYNDSGMGHCWTRATLTWQDAGHRVHHTRLMIQSDLATRLISDIRTDR